MYNKLFIILLTSFSIFSTTNVYAQSPPFFEEAVQIDSILKKIPGFFNVLENTMEIAMGNPGDTTKINCGKVHLSVANKQDSIEIAWTYGQLGNPATIIEREGFIGVVVDLKDINSRVYGDLADKFFSMNIYSAIPSPIEMTNTIIGGELFQVIRHDGELTEQAILEKEQFLMRYGLDRAVMVLIISKIDQVLGGKTNNSPPWFNLYSEAINYVNSNRAKKIVSINDFSTKDLDKLIKYMLQKKSK